MPSMTTSKRSHRYRSAGLLLVILFAALAARPPAAARSAGQQSPRILCYNAAARSAPACERLADLGAVQNPAWVVETATGGVLPGNLGSFDVLYLDTNTGDSLNGSLAAVRAYLDGGGGLFLTDPDFGARIGRGLQAPRSSRTPPAGRSIEFTRALRLTPALRDLQLAEMPTNPTTVPLNTLGSGWTVQAKLVEQGNLTLATTRFGLGRILLSPFVVDSAAPGDRYLEKNMFWLLDFFDELFTGNVMVDAIEVTQAIQSRSNDVILVQGKKTFVRVHARFPQSENKGQLPLVATLRGTAIIDIGNGNTVETELSPALSPVNVGGYAFISSQPDRDQLNDSFLFELPANWTGYAKLRLTAHVDPNGALNDPNQSNNVMSVVVNLAPAYPLRLRLYDFQYEFGGGVVGVPAFHFDRIESWLRRAYPIADLIVERKQHLYSTYGVPEAKYVNMELAILRAIDLVNGANPKLVYYGVVSDEIDFMRGLASGNYIASGPAGATGPGNWAWDTDGSYADWYAGHEIGHTRGRGHANFCGAKDGPGFPNPIGLISPGLDDVSGHFGFDIATRQIYGPTSWYDVMTYCDNQWISEFTYEGIYTFLAVESINPFRQGPAAETTGEHLIVIALADLDGGAGTLETVMVQSGVAPTLETEDSDWSIALLAAGGALLAEYPFAPEPPADTEDDPDPQLLINEIVPWVAGAARVQLRHGGEVLDERRVSNNAPTVTLQTPEVTAATLTIRWTAADADGDPLTFAVLYSADNGATWQSVAAGLTENSHTVKLTELPGGPQSRVRVLANDGLLTGEATSAPFAVATSAPDVTILAPAEGSAYYLAQPVMLSGTATDLEDGPLAGAALLWSSDRDGELGSGEALATAELSTGEHEIRLTATDSDGQQTSTARTIVILTADAEPEAALTVVPGSLRLDTTPGSAPVVFALTTRNAAGAPLNWTARSDRPWAGVHLAGQPPAASTVGATPADLHVTVDPSTLSPGVHEATITVSPAGAPPQTIDLTVTIEKPILFLPVLVR